MGLSVPNGLRMLQKDINSTFLVLVPLTDAVIALLPPFVPVDQGVYAFEYWVTQNGSPTGVKLEVGHNGIIEAVDVSIIYVGPSVYRVRGYQVVDEGSVTTWCEFQENGAASTLAFGGNPIIAATGVIEPFVRVVNDSLSDNLNLTVMGYYGQYQGGRPFPEL